jgi:sec-independent protein translocase protein TatC
VARKALPSPDKMTFLEHLEELRVRLIRSLIALVVGFAVCWNFADPIFRFLTEPMRKAYPKVQFIATAPGEAFFLYMKVSFFAGIFLAAPFILYQVWAFIAPGLYDHERSYAVPFIFFGSLFFVMGGLFGHYWLFPMTFEFLSQYGAGVIAYMPKISEYWSFYSWFLLGLGIVFQLPVVIFVLARIGLVYAGFLARQFKYACLGAFVLSAVITPSGDMVTQSALAVPLIGLYVIGIGVAWVFGRQRRDESGETVSAEART